VVHARRTRRRSEGWAKRAASFAFHRLLDRSACDVLRAMPERRRYLRGMAVRAGFPQAEVHYERTARAAGRTKYRLRSMISLGFEAIV
jgi:dolichol-phosphate mannosyltransferase